MSMETNNVEIFGKEDEGKNRRKKEEIQDPKTASFFEGPSDLARSRMWGQRSCTHLF